MSNDIIINNDKKNINIFFEIEYDIYKKTTIGHIFTQLNVICQIFNEEFNENLIKMYILYKKKLITDDITYYLKNILDLYFYLEKLEHLDQEEFFFIISKLIKINIIIKNLQLDDNLVNSANSANSTNSSNSSNLNQAKLVGNKYIKLINLDLINNSITNCIKQLSTDNIIIELFLNLINTIDINNKQIIINLSEKLAIDYFMYWNYSEIYSLIKRSYKIQDNIQHNAKNKTQNKTQYKNPIIVAIRKYKHDFIKFYKLRAGVFNELYNDHVNSTLITKFKYENNNKVFKDLILDIKSIIKYLKK